MKSVLPENFEVRARLLEKLMKNNNGWTIISTVSDSKSRIQFVAKVIPLGTTGFRAQFNRSAIVSGETPETTTIVRTLSLTYQLLTPNASPFIGGDVWNDRIVNVRSYNPIEAARGVLSRYLDIGSMRCSDCGMFSPDVVQNEDETKNLCKACAGFVIAGISVTSACSICQEEMLRPFQSFCGHFFHRKCVAEYVKMGGVECPNCRVVWVDADSSRMHVVLPYTPLMEGKYGVREFPMNVDRCFGVPEKSTQDAIEQKEHGDDVPFQETVDAELFRTENDNFLENRHEPTEASFPELERVIQESSIWFVLPRYHDGESSSP
jgi:hypothetical protein